MIIKSLDVECDYRYPGGRTCLTWVNGVAGSPHVREREARTRARAAGWKRRKGADGKWYDLCPDHAANRDVGMP